MLRVCGSMEPFEPRPLDLPLYKQGDHLIFVKNWHTLKNDDLNSACLNLLVVEVTLKFSYVNTIYSRSKKKVNVM